MEQKIIRGVFILLIIVLFGNAPEANAFTFLDGKFNVTGLYELLIGVHTQDHSLGYASSGDFSLFRHRADIQATFKPTMNIEFFTIFRAHWDGLYAIESGIDRRPRKRDQIEHEENFREWIMKLYWNNFSILMGRQQVVWGETDALRMADIINPLDVSWHSSLEAWEDIRIPLRMIRIIYRLPIAHEMDIDFVYIPEDYKMTKLWPEGHNWQNPNVDQYTLDVMHQMRPRGHSIDNNEIGIRIRGVFRGWELSVFDFYGRMDDPPFKVNPNQFPIEPSLYFDFPQMNTVGATANYFEGKYTKTVWRFECAYNMGENFTQFNYAPVFIGAPFPIMGVLPNKIVERDTFAYMFGFDRPTMWPFLNPTKSFFISGQLFQKFIRNYSSNILASLNNNRDEDTAISLLINTWYWHDTIQPEILAVYFTEGEGWIKPQIKWAPDHHLEVALGMFWFFGKAGDTDGVFGAYYKNDEVFLRLRYKF